MGDLYLALVHHPVLDKNGAVVTTAVTNMDVHDIARLSRTFAVRRYYVCTPVPTLQRGHRSEHQRVARGHDSPVRRYYYRMC